MSITKEQSARLTQLAGDLVITNTALGLKCDPTRYTHEDFNEALDASSQAQVAFEDFLKSLIDNGAEEPLAAPALTEQEN